MKSVTVRKSESHIYFIRIFMSALLIGAFGMLLWEPMYALLLLIPVGIAVPLWLYYETWQILFDKEKIVKKVFFRFCCSYSWYQLRKVTRVQSYTEGEQIKITFEDGKVLIFRMDDQNAQKALTRINKHRSIETQV